MRRHAVVWESVSTVCAILGQAFVGSVVVAALAVPFLTTSAFITAMLGGCTPEGVTRSAAKQAAQALGIVIPVLVFIPGTQILAGVLAPIAAVLGAYAVGRAPSADDLGRLAAGAAAAAGGDSPITPRTAQAVASRAAAALGATTTTTTGSTMAKFRPANSVITGTVWDNYKTVLSKGSPLADVGVMASRLLDAAQNTSAVRGASFDLSPSLRQQVGLILDDIARFRETMTPPVGVFARLYDERVSSTVSAYLDDILRTPLPAPWDVADVVEIVNDPLGAVRQPIDVDGRSPVVIDTGRSSGGGGGGGGGLAVVGGGLLLLLAAAGGR